tara:strand:- start:7836 stop:8372 length:537 start_codon:yes stop_codon:yes gene_type:complete
LSELDDALALSARDKIYQEITNNPGLHFRELQRRTDLATGSLQYHIDYLERRHFVRSVKQGKFVRYYSMRGEQFGEDETLMNLLRQESLRKIVLFLLTRKSATNFTIASAVDLSPSTVSWHMKKLSDNGVVEVRKRLRKKYFYLADPERVKNILRSYQKSFLDALVDHFVEIWDSMEV